MAADYKTGGFLTGVLFEETAFVAANRFQHAQPQNSTSTPHLLPTHRLHLTETSLLRNYCQSGLTDQLLPAPKLWSGQSPIIKINRKCSQFSPNPQPPHSPAPFSPHKPCALPIPAAPLPARPLRATTLLPARAWCSAMTAGTPPKCPSSSPPDSSSDLTLRRPTHSSFQFMLPHTSLSLMQSSPPNRSQLSAREGETLRKLGEGVIKIEKGREGNENKSYQQFQIILSMLGESCKASGWKGEGRRGRGSLIVEINIGAQQQSREIRIGDVHDLAKTDQQIRCFMAAHNLKEGAFSYLRTLIQQQATLQPPARRNCSPHCKCATKMQVFEEKERRLSEMMSGKNSPSRQSFSRSPDRVGKREPQHLEIKLTTHDPTIPVRSRREESAESFVFNSSFTLPSSIGERDRVFMTDELFENAFGEGKDESSSNLSEFQSAGEHVQINKVKANPIRMKLKPKESKGRAKESEEKGRMKENELVMSSPTFRKPNPKETTPQKTKIKLTLHNEETQNRQTSGRKTKMLSTRERKEAIMTPKKPALTPKKMKESAETSKANLLILNAENLEHMVSQHKRSLQEMSTRLSKQALQQPLFNQKCLPGQFQEVLVGLFRKLTQNNPPHMKELHSQYVSYQQLAREELHFMGVLFEKIDHKELNNLDYDNFRSNSLKYCWAELEAMAHRNDRQEFLYF